MVMDITIINKYAILMIFNLVVVNLLNKMQVSMLFYIEMNFR